MVENGTQVLCKLPNWTNIFDERPHSSLSDVKVVLTIIAESYFGFLASVFIVCDLTSSDITNSLFP
jgi:hypothetical protein